MQLYRSEFLIFFKSYYVTRKLLFVDILTYILPKHKCNVKNVINNEACFKSRVFSRNTNVLVIMKFTTESAPRVSTRLDLFTPHFTMSFSAQTDNPPTRLHKR